jgi:hypothetical protein
MTFSFRLATADDARAAATVYESSGLPGAPISPGEFERLTQTGHAFLVAEADGHLFGAIRVREDEGIAWFDLLVSRRAWAGAHLVRAVERGAQDRGIRLVRAVAPDSGVLQDYFARLGYLPIGRQPSPEGQAELLLERRLPLLTVREQRRSDARAIADLTGEDEWVFEQGARPGWFVVSDGDRVVGAIQVRDAGSGVARMTDPALLPAYRGRHLEIWMLERAGTYAETNGYHTAEAEAVPDLEPLKRDLEDRRWFREGDVWRRVFFTPRADDDD